MGGNIVYPRSTMRGGKFGSPPSSYAEFDGSGYLWAFGNSPTYDDLPPYPVLIAKLGASAPTLTSLVVGIQEYTFAVSNYVEGRTEITHRFKQGADMTFHIHWLNQGTNAGNTYAAWQIGYAVGIPGQPLSALSYLNISVLLPSTLTHATTFISGFSAISSANWTIGSYLYYTMTRVAITGGSNPAANPYVTAVGLHCKQDSLGSRGLFTK